MIWHGAEWTLDCTESDGEFWVLSLEWDDDGDYTQWDPIDEFEAKLLTKDREE